MLSIIIPVYNAEKYINQCIESILKQHYEDIEIILVNDGSSDRSGEICDYLSETHYNIHVYHKINGGASSARNLGLSKAKGDWIYFMDSDDYLKDSFFEKIVLNINPDIDCVIFQHSLNGNSKDFQLILDECTVYTGQELLLELYQQDKMFVPVWKYIYKRNWLISKGFRFVEGIIYEDEVWTKTLLCHASKVQFINWIGYDYNIRDNSVMTTLHTKKNYQSKLIAASHIDNLINSKVKLDKRLKYILKKESASYFMNSCLNIYKCKEASLYSIVEDNIKLLMNARSLKQITAIPLLVCLCLFYHITKK